VTPYAPADQGGFYNYVLFHVLPDGSVQFAVQPVLASIAVTAPQPAPAVGATEQPSATGTTPAGDDLSALQVTARSPGTATISVLSGGVTGSVTVAVSQ
jgi:hypothetical protein